MGVEGVFEMCVEKNQTYKFLLVLRVFVIPALWWSTLLPRPDWPLPHGLPTLWSASSHQPCDGRRCLGRGQIGHYSTDCRHFGLLHHTSLTMGRRCRPRPDWPLPHGMPTLWSASSYQPCDGSTLLGPRPDWPLPHGLPTLWIFIIPGLRWVELQGHRGDKRRVTFIILAMSLTRKDNNKIQFDFVVVCLIIMTFLYLLNERSENVYSIIYFVVVVFSSSTKKRKV